MLFRSRYLNEFVEREWARSIRENTMISVIMVDLDFFKAVNDHYGHATGDDYLRAVAQVLQQHAARASDLAARYGGEEFVCLLPDTDVLGAVSLAERIRKAVMQCGIPHAASRAASVVTVSIGVVSCVCHDSILPEQIVQRADEQLYLAKNEGRNCVKFSADGAGLRVQRHAGSRWGLKVVWNEEYSSGFSQ